MVEELETCPFCDSEVELIPSERQWIYCKTCECGFQPKPSQIYPHVDVVIWWNTRPNNRN